MIIITIIKKLKTGIWSRIPLRFVPLNQMKDILTKRVILCDCESGGIYKVRVETLGLILYNITEW